MPGEETQSTSTDWTSIFIRAALGPSTIEPHLGCTAPSVVALDAPADSGFCGEGAGAAEYNPNHFASRFYADHFRWGRDFENNLRPTGG